MSEYLPLESVLERLRAGGQEISERTFRYLVSAGLIAPPVRDPHQKSDGRMRFYPADVVPRIQRIRALQERGFSLRQIRRHLATDTSLEGNEPLVRLAAQAPPP